MQQQDNVFSFQKILFAGILTFVFLGIYTYFFPQKQEIQTKEEAKKEAPVHSSITSKEEKDEVLLRVDAKEFALEFDTLGRIRQVYLKNKKFLTPKQESLIGKIFGSKKEEQTLSALPLLDLASIRPLEVRFADSKINDMAFSTPYKTEQKQIQMQDSPIQIELVQEMQGLVFKKIITLNPDLSYSVEFESSNASVEYFVSNGARPVADADQYAFLGTIIANKDLKLEKLEDDDEVEGLERFGDSVFVAGVDRYFASIFYSPSKNLNVVVDGKIKDKNPIAFVSLVGNAKIEAYIGAKNYQELKALYAPLGDVVEYGLISFFAKPLFLLLEILHKFCGNWGWAIVLLTLIVRLALFPLSYKGMMGMQKLKEIAPQMKEIQAKYKSEPQKMQKHMMDLYKKNGANPLGGCLPLLLQIPVFFAIYKVLYCAVELKSVPWILWITDLSAIDPYYVLPLIMGGTMYISQMMTPSNFTDPTQEKVFKMLPLFFTIFFIIFPFPAGLVLYWSVNNVISIFQQMLINRIVEKQKKAKQ